LLSALTKFMTEHPDASTREAVKHLGVSTRNFSEQNAALVEQGSGFAARTAAPVRGISMWGHLDAPLNGNMPPTMPPT
jgi:hypothetical protein